ncbi:FtsH protease activity modulator HflK [Pelomicrobium methylotrophicum]|uniref:Protein HflK n=1 Tax=Pelomicrobium methylotrophicum TaxID=2602750 RepID=A0A5C7EFR7_9PROT|nr:FtsH protease activity modulator HflK [Pelomicrobium methylotrophicum]TXF11073.1 FtsH protease activity modulator HflK [Pelomicrobium methylotrophicum]
MNDPQWGRRGRQGPPDLDELWRSAQEKLAGLFGGRRRPNGGGAPPSGPAKGGIGLLIGLLLLVWLASGFYIVDASQRGVVLRFGKYVETTLPGPRWHLPYPIETVEIVNLSQVRTVEVGYRNDVRSKVLKEALMLTDDENIVDIQFAVQYILKNPEDYLFNNRGPEEAVRQVAETAFREVVGKSKMDFVLYEGREEVAARAHKLMQDILDRYGTGIQISKVNLQNAQPPEQVQDAFDDAVKAGQDRERLINEGYAYANDVIPKARGTAARLLEEAEAYRAQVIARAEGDANRFRQLQSEYAKAPGVTRERLYLDTMQQVLSSTSKVLIDQKGGGNLLMLPLDKLLQMSGAGASAEAAGSAKPSTVPEPAAEAGARSRDAFRSRERETRP